MRAIEIPCKWCHKFFLNEETKLRLYCSKECYREMRAIYTRDHQRNRIRKKNGTLQKWADILKENGYRVISPVVST